MNVDLLSQEENGAGLTMYVTVDRRISSMAWETHPYMKKSTWHIVGPHIDTAVHMCKGPAGPQQGECDETLRMGPSLALSLCTRCMTERRSTLLNKRR